MLHVVSHSGTMLGWYDVGTVLAWYYANLVLWYGATRRSVAKYPGA